MPNDIGDLAAVDGGIDRLERLDAAQTVLGGRVGLAVTGEHPPGEGGELLSVGVLLQVLKTAE